MADTHDLRELLFGDVPLHRWAGTGDAPPWSLFRAAATHLAADDATAARAALADVLAQPGLESRHYLQAWDALRTLGLTPPADQAKHVYGVVLDVPVTGGLDTLAAYEDHTCRYLNHSGSAIIWEQPDPIIDPLIERLLAAGRDLVHLIGPWDGSRPPLPTGQARLSLLCPSGLHFGQAPLNVLQSDERAQAAFATGAQLLAALVSHTLTP